MEAEYTVGLLLSALLLVYLAWALARPEHFG